MKQKKRKGKGKGKERITERGYEIEWNRKRGKKEERKGDRAERNITEIKEVKPRVVMDGINRPKTKSLKEEKRLKERAVVRYKIMSW